MNAQLLRLKDSPFLLTLLTGLLAWMVTHAVDRLQKSPIIGYRLFEYQSNGITRVHCEIENFCADKVFTGITFSLGGPRTDLESYTDRHPSVKAPTHMPKDVSTGSTSVSCMFPEFHPAWRVTLDAGKQGNFKPFLQFDLKESDQDVEPVLLLRYGWQTVLIRYEFRILGALIAVAMVFTGWYLHWLNKAVAGGRKMDPTPSKDLESKAP